MSLPPKAVPKSAAAVVTGPGTGPSPSGQLRATLTHGSLPPGAPVAPQPPPPIPRVQPSLEDRIFPAQPGVAAIYSVPRHPGPPYTTHDIAKGHPNLAGTPPGHASSPGLSQSPYAAGQNAGSAPLVYSPQGQPMNAQPQTRAFATGPRPTHHQGGFRPIQFFQRAQMPPARAAIPSSSPSIRPGSQAPSGAPVYNPNQAIRSGAQTPSAAAVYPPNQPIMMTMTPLPFPSPQAAQYYIPQYRHSAPYVGPPQQYSVQPPGPGTFYPGPGPGDFPTPYATPPYYPGQTVYPPSPPIIVPTPQQPPPAKREKKPIRIRDPNQGGKDITEEIMSWGGSGSRNPTPPSGRPSSTPTPPQPSSQTPDLSHTPDHGRTSYSVETPPLPVPVAPDSTPAADDRPKLEAAVLKAPPAGLQLPEAPSDPAPGLPAAPPPLVRPDTPELAGEGEPAETLAPSQEPEAAWPLPQPLPQPEGWDLEKPLPDPAPTAPAGPALRAVNGVADRDTDSPGCDVGPTESPCREPAPPQPQLPAPCPSTHPQEPGSAPGQDNGPAPPAGASVAPVPLATPSLVNAPAASLPPPPGLLLPVQPAAEAGDARSQSLGAESAERPLLAGEDTEITASEEHPQPLANSRKSPITAHPTSASPKTWKKPNEDSGGGDVLETETEVGPGEMEAGDAALEAEPEHRSPPPEEAEEPLIPEENGEAELEAEIMRNGAGNASETESSDSGLTAGERDSSTRAAPYLPQEEPTQTHRKRQYDRDFLLGFQFTPACVQKPEGLPAISDVVLDKINQNKLPSRAVDSRVISRGPDFTPAFADFSRQIPGGRGAALMSVGVRRPQPRKIIMNVSVNDEVQLKRAENAWKPGIKRETGGDDPQAEKTQELFRKVRSILNKLTPQMFQQLMKQVTDLTIDTEERLKGVIDLVFEKAIDEPSFSVAYGNMCRCLATLKVPMAEKPNTTVNFRKLLLNRCQKEFEKDKVDDVVFERKQQELDSAASASERERLQEELEEAKDKARRRSIGNIKFIGELFKLKMLTEAIMHDCVVKLLKNHDEESLECLCRLLTTIGKDLDFEKAKPRMDQYFNQMEKIVKERKTSSRIRFMLQDVIDLRLHNWVSRRADQGPKTIEQIHKEAKIEEQEEQRKVHQQLLSKDKRRPEQRAQREETWSTVPMTKNSRTIDPTKIPRISKPTIDDKIQLGPRAQLNWVKGSSGGAKASDADLSRSGGSSLNRYSALQSSSPHTSTPPPVTPDFDSRRTSLSSRGSTGRERNDKPPSSAPSRPSPSARGGTKELQETPSSEEQRDTPDTPGSAPDPEPERCRARDPVKVESPDRPCLSEEEMERKSKSIIDEFLHINDFKEALQCVEELDQASQLHMFVRVGVESTLERSHSTRDHIGQLFFQMLHSGMLSKAQFFRGFVETLELADDMAIDIPHIWLYLAELVTPVLREGGVSVRELFSEFSKPLLPVGRAGILFSEILHLLCKQMSHRKVGALWRESGLSWEDFLAEGEDVSCFISEQKLEFTVSDCSSPTAGHSKRTLSPEELSQKLEKLLLEEVATDEQIFDWVEANLDESQMSSPPFLRALMTTVCKAAVKEDSASYRVDTAIIQRRLPVLLKYLNSDTERQLQALYALQALIVSLDQPPNLLRMFFDCLYDEDVISEDAFYRWESSKDPAEQQGKGVALKSVTAFFTWLREAEEESEDN
ncbi:eukaryotic translation initiation factor 4 gamma 3 isoform X2 [Megalops cyprinoides]|uniref:eukaryotic translation initiation factor 4 gamma 3 isoform X2 n=1 Tax=Megalops cyprinoides TaxID=118141 RepID=UPI0018652F84|nr:eukaryotic translation initiation factor 4 gamma 3 isoform X2 [Megalops cyprinoides]